MGWIDTRLEFSDAQALTATAASTNHIDLGGDFDVGVGRPVWICVSLDVASDFTTGNETYVVDLQTDDNTSFSSATSIAQFSIVGANPAGTKFAIVIPQANEQFMRLNYTLGGTTPTVTLSAWVQFDEPTKWVSYPDAVN